MSYEKNIGDNIYIYIYIYIYSSNLISDFHKIIVIKQI